MSLKMMLKLKTLTTTTTSAIGKLFLFSLCFSSSFYATPYSTKPVSFLSTSAASLAQLLAHRSVLFAIVFLNVFAGHICPVSGRRRSNNNKNAEGGDESDVCRQFDTCACRLTNGSGIINLQGVAFYNGNPRFVIRESEGISLAYNPCAAFTLKPGMSFFLGLLKKEKAEGETDNNLTKVKDKVEANDCTNAAVCKFPTSGDGNSLQYKNLGQPDSAKFNFDQKEKKLFIRYMSPDLSFTTTVYLACNKINQLSIKEESNNSLTLNLQTVCACPNGCYSPMMTTFSPGTYILIVFTSVLLSYLILGILYKKIIHSAEGIELIPNRESWTSFFSLVKDGYLFFISPCLGNTVEYRYYQQL